MKNYSLFLLLILLSSNAFSNVQEYIDGCVKGDLDACDYAADSYKEGDETHQDINEAFKYYSKACDLNSGYGCRWFGLFQDPDFNEYKIPKSYKNSSSAYRKGCNLGDSTSCNNLATAYKQGKGIGLDLAIARKYYIQACTQMDDGDACANLGYMYDEGQGVTIDKSLAAKYYAMGCDQFDEGMSCFNLANFFYNGEGVQENKSRAKAYYSKACENGDDNGCSSLEDLAFPQ